MTAATLESTPGPGAEPVRDTMQQWLDVITEGAVVVVGRENSGPQVATRRHAVKLLASNQVGQCLHLEDDTAAPTALVDHERQVLNPPMLHKATKVGIQSWAQLPAEEVGLPQHALPRAGVGRKIAPELATYKDVNDAAPSSDGFGARMLRFFCAGRPTTCKRYTLLELEQRACDAEGEVEMLHKQLLQLQVQLSEMTAAALQSAAAYAQHDQGTQAAAAALQQDMQHAVADLKQQLHTAQNAAACERAAAQDAVIAVAVIAQEVQQLRARDAAAVRAQQEAAATKAAGAVQLEQLQQSNSQAAAKVAAFESHNKALQDTHKREMAALAGQLGSTQQQLADVITASHAKVAQLESEMAALITEVAALQDQFAAVNASKDDKLAAAEAINADLKSTLATLQQQLHTEREERHALQQQLIAVAAERDAAAAAVQHEATQKEQLLSVQQQLSSAQAEACSMHQELECAHTEVASLQQQLGTAHSDVQNLQEQLNGAQVNSNGLQQQLQELQAKLQQHQQQQPADVVCDLPSVQLQQELGAMQQRVIAADQAREAAEQAKAAAEQRKAAAEQAASEIQKQLSNKRALNQQVNVNNKLQLQLSTAKEGNKRLTEQVLQLQSKVASADRDRADALHTLRAKLAAEHLAEEDQLRHVLNEKHDVQLTRIKNVAREQALQRIRELEKQHVVASRQLKQQHEAESRQLQQAKAAACEQAGHYRQQLEQLMMQQAQQEVEVKAARRAVETATQAAEAANRAAEQHCKDADAAKDMQVHVAAEYLKLKKDLKAAKAQLSSMQQARQATYESSSDEEMSPVGRQDQRHSKPHVQDRARSGGKGKQGQRGQDQSKQDQGLSSEEPYPVMLSTIYTDIEHTNRVREPINYTPSSHPSGHGQGRGGGGGGGAGRTHMGPGGRGGYEARAGDQTRSAQTFQPQQTANAGGQDRPAQNQLWPPQAAIMQPAPGTQQAVRGMNANKRCNAGRRRNRRRGKGHAGVPDQ